MPKAVIPPHFRIAFAPQADPAAIVRAGAARFTVLTSRLIRMEYDPAGCFEDRASQTFWYRRQPVPKFQVTRAGGVVQIVTEHLHLRYGEEARGFSRDKLSITLKETGVTWRYGDKDKDNLLGTARTLDTANGRVRLAPGLMSRSGWSLIDDSRGLVFDEDCWLQSRAAANPDLYFFGYGQRYDDCLADYRKVAGATPMIPRWILGNWWSRYWAYTQDELTALMQDFERHEVPLGVCIIDMDWHITDTGSAASGWTGYTWNRDLWPDPYRFIAWLHQKGLRTAMNLHPADGVWPHEEQYPAMARAMGIDPASQKPVPFDIADPAFANAYFDVLHHPMEERGVDFWWIDWQQGTQSKVSGLDPLWWLNHLHFLDRGRDGAKRPFVFSRWGGISNHRYPIGFSGDTVVSWDSLAFQPYFTATAANVSYGWWSHDIGGHMGGHEDPELYARWVQWGVFSPILRLHSTNNPYHDRRPWGHGEEVLQVARAAMQLRHRLIPYLYSMAWRDHQQALPLCAPMYHAYPDADDAYHCPNEYLFGSELLASPFVHKADPATRLSRQVVWLPEGDWYDFFSGERFAGGGWRAVYGDLTRTPVFARAGAIVPLGLAVGWGGIDKPDAIDLHVFAGANNRFELYEDDGDSTAYLKGVYAITAIEQEWSANSLSVTIHAAEGDATQVPAKRAYRLIVHGAREPDAIVVQVAGKKQTVTITYDAVAETLTLSPLAVRATETARVTLSVGGGDLLARRDRRLETVRTMLAAFHLESHVKQGIAERLESLAAGANILGDYEMDLGTTQALAIVETMRGVALDRV